ncbi:Structural maintenance of chromosomes protein 5 [Ceratocystis fimbriata CBS 114723]|uniref:Structural maintenance of chromosomes protein 5 n=1 Tax=Ceratocystis fimbriata CBS 114723 TaxID=1035309 RepID=A0A2C5WY11_9PEZI|nr:Structural maintenance of chromosomes protein 5 [Ceratocystis fimbriata CBS 114723]
MAREYRGDSSQGISPSRQRSEATQSTSSWTRDNYQVGAIMRVFVQDFLTYDKAEFVPGPFLNMVIGPNGTGKSSLVNAICLGLGFPAKLLGRATTIGEFVKHNQSSAVIETELRGPGPDNINIRVKITRETNQTSWWLDKKSVPHKRIQEVVKSLKIQVDNLCQFLPQDRVVEFARLNEVDLLTETLRAAAPEEVSTTHQFLQVQHKAKEDIQKRIEILQSSLEASRKRQSGLQAEVDRITEREEIRQLIDMLESAKIFAEYNALTESWKRSKRKRKAAHENLQRLKTQSEPALEVLKNKEDYLKSLARASRERQEKVQQAERAVQQASTKLEEMNDKINAFGDEISQADTEYRITKSEAKNISRKLFELQKSQENDPIGELDIEAINQEIRQNEHLIRDRVSEMQAHKSKIETLRGPMESKRTEKAKLENNLRALDTQQGQRMNLLRRLSPDAKAGWEWLESNKDRFKMEVFGPAMLTCSVKNERYADQVEALLAKSDLTCFTAQCREDHTALSEQLYKKMGLSVTIRTCTTRLESMKSPISQDEVQRLGIDGFAIDLMEGPEPILAMLCVEKRLHTAVVSLRSINDAEFSYLESIPAISNMVIGNQGYRIARRRDYGNVSTTNVRQIKQAELLVNQTGGMATEKQNIERRIAELDDDMAQLRQTALEHKNSYKELGRSNDDMDTKISQLRAKKEDYQRETSRREAIPGKIAKARADLARLQKAMREKRHAVQDIKLQARLATIRLGPIALSMAAKVVEHREQIKKRAMHNILVIEAESDVQFLNARVDNVKRQLKEEQNKVAELAKACDELREQGKSLAKLVGAIKEKYEDPDVLRPFYVDKTVDEVTGKLEAERAKLELLHVGDPATMRLYEELNVAIADTQRHLENSHARLQEYQQNIEEKQSMWEPQVELLIRKISDAFAYNFEQIGCAGEVRLHKAENFDQWALHIMVCFRCVTIQPNLELVYLLTIHFIHSIHEGNGQLVQLTGNRQSGGERSVSTIFFLMALQSDAQSPFRVVDEINQGMDPRNERMVHNRMVQIACREHSCQYFLITPKLLTNLSYDDKMTVLCIASGPQMPPDVMKLDFASLIRKQRRLMAA